MKVLGKVDMTFLPIGGTFTMNIPEAVQATSIIKPNMVVPMHFLKVKPQDFKKEVEKRSKIKVEILKTGEVINL
jgi:L-ascorbate metabolism protein UlaG (beta-lactamase superfamily)